MAETLKIPSKVVKADWKDDIGLDYETYGGEKQEMEYVSPENIPRESIERIKSIDLRQRFKDHGRKISDVFKGEKIAA